MPETSDLGQSDCRRNVIQLCDDTVRAQGPQQRSAAPAAIPLTIFPERTMAVKSQIIAELGEPDLLAPERIARSLVANDQVKYYFALLQMARSNADRPAAPVRGALTGGSHGYRRRW